MGFFRTLRDANGMVRLDRGVTDTESKWQRLSETDRRRIAERAKKQIDSAMVKKNGGWTYEQTCDEGRKLQQAAALQFNVDSEAAYANWFTGAWLESRFSSIDDAVVVSVRIEAILMGSLDHLRIYWYPREGVTQFIDDL